MLISAEVCNCVLEPFGNSHTELRHARARSVLDGFIEGDWIAVGWYPFDKGSSAVLARVDPVEDDIWDFRCLSPTPGIRVFGCFSEPDTFVALTWEYRENIVEFAAEVARCAAAWKELFGSIPPYRRSRLDEYVTYNCNAV